MKNQELGNQMLTYMTILPWPELPYPTFAARTADEFCLSGDHHKNHSKMNSNGKETSGAYLCSIKTEEHASRDTNSVQVLLDSVLN